MKIIFRRRGTTMAYAVFSSILLAACLAFIVICLAIQAYGALLLSAVPTLAGILLAAMAQASHRATLEIDGRDVIFHYPVFSQSPELNGKHVRLPYDEVESIEKLTFGKRSVLYRFVLADGRRLDAYLYHFGRKTETDILRLLENDLVLPQDA